jgi:hypothetical protein
VTAGLLATAALTYSGTADAKTRIYLNFGPDCYGYGCGYGYGYLGPHRHYANPYYLHPRRYDPYRSVVRISCGEARSILRSRGYRNIATRDCKGSSYSFRATRRGKVYIVAVSSRTGAIISVRRV